MRKARSTRLSVAVGRLLGLAASVVALTGGIGKALANDLPRQVSLTASEVTRIIQQAVGEAQARNSAATVAVVDRVGNVLAVYQMRGADPNLLIDAERAVEPPRGLTFAFIDGGAGAGAIAKAITGAYLSSNGNAFSTRTASQIVQENFNPGSRGLEGGPLFGVQFSSLPCSDLTARFASNAGGTIDQRIGPKRSPLGLAADPGGFPIYKDGTLVGGVGVFADGRYGLDRNIRDRDNDLDELIARAAVESFGPPDDIRADRVTVDGRTLRYADAGSGDLRSNPGNAGGINLAGLGSFIRVNGYFTSRQPLDGQAFGFGSSGIRPDPNGRFGSSRAYVLTNAAGANRFPPRAGKGTGALSATEVTRLLSKALEVALDARGQIRRPLGSHAEVTISVVDTNGTILGIVRTPDAPIFGTDVSLQKARSAMFFSNPAAPNDLSRVKHPGSSFGYAPREYIPDIRNFIGENAINGSIAYSNRAVGNLARPFYPDGVNGNPSGPLSIAFNQWSPFYTGLQVDLVATNILQHVGFIQGGRDTPARCAGLTRLANGLQIFPGGFPIYRGRQLVGGIGISGDGIDQDDMIGFLGVDRTGGGLNNAPQDIRADRQDPNNVNLRYIQCPFSPFLDSDDQSVCQGK